MKSETSYLYDLKESDEDYTQRELRAETRLTGPRVRPPLPSKREILFVFDNEEIRQFYFHSRYMCTVYEVSSALCELSKSISVLVLDHICYICNSFIYSVIDSCSSQDSEDATRRSELIAGPLKVAQVRQNFRQNFSCVYHS